jgi:hypothetical protein
MFNRAKMIYVYLAFLLIWYAGAILAVKFMGISVLEGVGLGTAGGVFIGAFKDAWQFMWRKASMKEEAANTSPDKVG